MRVTIQTVAGERICYDNIDRIEYYSTSTTTLGIKGADQPNVLRINEAAVVTVLLEADER